jgi:hypothetical protein
MRRLAVGKYIPPGRRSSPSKSAYVIPARRTASAQRTIPPLPPSPPSTSPAQPSPSTDCAGVVADPSDAALAKLVLLLASKARISEGYKPRAVVEQIETKPSDVWRKKRKGGNRAPTLEPKGCMNWRTGSTMSRKAAPYEDRCPKSSDQNFKGSKQAPSLVQVGSSRM